MPRTLAISFDFFDTLVHHAGAGRGTRLMEYFRANGWVADAWEHQVLYDVFREHGMQYDPAATDARHAEFCQGFAETLFRRLNVQRNGASAEHALAIWRILGPDSLVVFPEVEKTLTRLRAAGYPLIVVSNWQRGLGGFCNTLQLARHFTHIISSDEVNVAKPDARIFKEACRRLGVGAERVLHVGDSVVDDYDGARAAGLRALLLARGETGAIPTSVRRISSLDADAIIAGAEDEGST